MSRPRSERRAESATEGVRRPDDHVDAPEAPSAPTQPKLSPLGWLRFLWRQLTSMRTAIILLLLLALAAVPGSLVPQRSSDPNGVIQYQQEHPELYDALDALGVFSTFSAPWFSAIYLLLFISLIGCIIPRAQHHIAALRARPPRTPAQLSRLVGHRASSSAAAPEEAIEAARRVLRRQGYRVERYDQGSRLTVSAERGYLRETGNLVFHVAMVGVLAVVAIGGGLGWTGQRVLVEGTAFTNTLASYDSINPGRFFDEDALDPFSLRLDSFTPQYEFDISTGKWNPLDFDAEMSTREQGGDWQSATLKVNEPLAVGDTQIYLLGNGYAPEITVRDPEGNAVLEGPIVFRPQDANLFSLGVVKVPDGLAEQVGMVGLFYPDPVATSSGALASFSPDPNGPILTLEVYTGDLGLDTGTPVNVYTLNTDGLTQIAGRQSDVESLQLSQGDVVELPNGLGTVEFTGLRRYVAVDVHHDPTGAWVLLFAVLILGGLLVSLFVPRRRVWITAEPADGGSALEFAGLARGEDPLLEGAVADLAARMRESLGDPPAEPEEASAAPGGRGRRIVP